MVTYVDSRKGESSATLSSNIELGSYCYCVIVRVVMEVNAAVNSMFHAFDIMRDVVAFTINRSPGHHK